MNAKHQQILQAAIEAGYLGEQQALAAFIDTGSLAETISALQQAFPDHFSHTFAAKANTMSRALAFVKDHGMGCETDDLPAKAYIAVVDLDHLFEHQANQ